MPSAIRCYNGDLLSVFPAAGGGWASANPAPLSNQTKGVTQRCTAGTDASCVLNLTTGTIHEEAFSHEQALKYFGGRGLAIRALLEGMDPTADPLSPENLLVMATGPLTSTPAPTGNRYMVVTKSPLTGGLANSNAAASFPA